jgi:DNA polymerase elongation subunit (family B)
MLKIDAYDYDGYVYDITTSNFNNFYADGILIHNCGKKKYVMHVLNSEGVDYIGKDKYKIMGMESVKSSTPAWARSALTDLYKIALSKSESDVHELIEQTRESFDEMPVYEIAIPRGTNDIEKYVDQQGMPAKGCPKHVRAAIVHNRFIEEHSIGRIPKIQSGDKIKFVELKQPNPVSSPVVGFIEYPPKEMQLDKYVDYDLIFESAFEKPAKIFLDAIEWTLEETNTLF